MNAIQGHNPEESQKNSKTPPKIHLSNRKAIVKLKENFKHVELMKKRFKVLAIQEQQNRYRSIDIQRRIANHNDLHEAIQKDKSYLNYSLSQLDNSQELKLQTNKIKVEVQEGVSQAKQALLTLRKEQGKSVKIQSQQNDKFVDENRKIIVQLNKRRKNFVVQREKDRREFLENYKIQKFQSIQLKKSKEKDKIINESRMYEKQIQAMSKQEQKMILKNSESIQASRALSHRFQKVLHGKKDPCLFPLIKRSTDTQATNSQ